MRKHAKGVRKVVTSGQRWGVDRDRTPGNFLGAEKFLRFHLGGSHRGVCIGKNNFVELRT